VSVADTSPVRFGVIGARSMVATKAVMPAIDASERAQLTSVSSLGGPVPERWEHLGAGLYDDVIDHPDVEVVYIPLPNGLHLEWVERAIAAGKHVMCEKPITPTAADAQRLADSAERAGVLLAEAWMTPFDARWRRAMSSPRSADRRAACFPVNGSRSISSAICLAWRRRPASWSTGSVRAASI